MPEKRLFEIYPTGDCCSRAWDVSEYADSFEEDTCTYRGDISGRFAKMRLIVELRRLYPGCKIRVRK